MGVVYSSREMQDARIPQVGSHGRAATSVIQNISRLEGAALTVVHGSVVEGRSNLRSDLDVLVLYEVEVPAQEPVVVRKLKTALDQVGKDTHVKIEANLWPAKESLHARRERMHDLLFSRHLAQSMEHPDWAVGEPDEAIAEIAANSYGDELLRRVVLNYTTYKHGGFTGAPVTFSETDRTLYALQRAFEFPKSIGRKACQLFGYDGDVTTEKSWAAMDGSGLEQQAMEALAQLRDLDLCYSVMVEELGQIQAPLDAHGIKQYLEWVESAYRQAIDLGIIAASGFTNFVAEI